MVLVELVTYEVTHQTARPWQHSGIEHRHITDRNTSEHAGRGSRCISKSTSDYNHDQKLHGPARETRPPTLHVKYARWSHTIRERPTFPDDQQSPRRGSLEAHLFGIAIWHGEQARVHGQGHHLAAQGQQRRRDQPPAACEPTVGEVERGIGCRAFAKGVAADYAGFAGVESQDRGSRGEITSAGEETPRGS